MLTFPPNFQFRYDQEEIVKEIERQFQDHNDVAFSAPTDYGKTIVTCVVALGQPLPVTYLTSTYAGVKDIIKTLELLGHHKKPSIILPKGLRLVRKYACKQKRCGGCPKRNSKIPTLHNADFKGQVVDAKWVLKQRPNLCPYRFLLEASKVADWVITHYAMIPNPLGRGGHLETGGFLIVDEVDEALKPKDVLLAKFRISPRGFHLETPREELIIRKAIEILDEVKETYNPYHKNEVDYFPLTDWCDNFKELLTWFYDWLNENPIIYELENIEKWGTKKDDIAYALKTATQKLQDRVKTLQILLNKGDLKKVTDKIAKNYREVYLSKLEPDDRGLIQDLVYCFSQGKNFYFHKVDFSPVEKSGYVEVWMVTGESNFQERVSHYKKRLFLSATFPSNMSKDIPLVKTDVDPNGVKKLVIQVPNRNVQVRVLHELLQDHNVLGVTTSKWRAQEAKRRYGGHIIYKDTNIYQIERKCEAHKGNLYWIYYGSKHGRAINTLARFDAVVFQEFLDKSDQLTLGVNTQYEENCVKKLYQTASRVLRTIGDTHRARSLITCNPHAFELLRQESPLWQYEKFEHTKDAVERIKKHTEPLPTKAPLKPVKLIPRYDKKRKKHYLVGEITPDHLRKYSLKELILTDDDIWLLLHKESESE